MAITIITARVVTCTSEADLATLLNTWTIGLLQNEVKIICKGGFFTVVAFVGVLTPP